MSSRVSSYHPASRRDCSDSSPGSSADIAADPFGESRACRYGLKAQLLGGDFEFETDSARLHRLARWAYAHLPPQELACAGPLRVRLALAPAREADTGQMPNLGMLCAPQLLCGMTGGATFCAVSAVSRAALVVVARELLSFSYHVRYELIEFAVFTLAARALELVPLHAAGVAANGRALLLVGESGSGKSTAALHWSLRRNPILAEDSVFVDPRRMRVRGVPNFLHVTREALCFLGARDAALVRRSPVIRRRSGIEKFELDLRAPRFHLSGAPGALAGIVFLSRQQARGRRLLAALDPGAALRRLGALQPYAAQQPQWGSFCASAAHVPLLELRRGRHPEASIDALEELLG